MARYRFIVPYQQYPKGYLIDLPDNASTQAFLKLGKVELAEKEQEAKQELAKKVVKVKPLKARKKSA